MAPALLAAWALAVVLPGAALASTPAPGTAKQVAALVAASTRIQKLSAKLAAALPTASSDNASAAYAIPSDCPTAAACVYGDQAASASVVLYGDSHARMWLPAVDPIVTRHKLRLILIGQDDCPVESLVLPKAFQGCNAAQPGYIAAINAARPRVILISQRTSYPGFTEAAWQSGLTTTIRDLRPSKAKVVVIGDIQVVNLEVLACLAAFPTKVQRCSTANPDTYVPGQERAERASAKATTSTYVDPTPWLCTKTRCSPVIGGFIAYWSPYHVSVHYARYLAGVMGAALKAKL